MNESLASVRVEPRDIVPVRVDVILVQTANGIDQLLIDLEGKGGGVVGGGATTGCHRCKEGEEGGEAAPDIYAAHADFRSVIVERMVAKSSTGHSVKWR